ncbi:MAG: GPW/gp25 family protein [Halobacteriota archaeon]
MAKDFLGRGWKFPVNIDAKGRIEMSEHENDVQEAIRIIIGTARGGERLMRLDFGCGIHDYVFAQVNTTTLAQVRASVLEALTRWEPRIDVVQLDVESDKTADGRLLIHLTYKVRATNNQFNMVYPFYVKEGS